MYWKVQKFRQTQLPIVNLCDRAAIELIQCHEEVWSYEDWTCRWNAIEVIDDGLREKIECSTGLWLGGDLFVKDRCDLNSEQLWIRDYVVQLDWTAMCNSQWVIQFNVGVEPRKSPMFWEF